MPMEVTNDAYSIEELHYTSRELRMLRIEDW